jgi:hypothetical protein
MATNIALTSFKATAALPSYQGVWMPTVAWIGAIRRETKTESTDIAVSKAIKKVIFDSVGLPKDTQLQPIRSSSR